ncbi:MAG: NAD-dependent epimerase/dehydratase family protein [Candidatus Nanopelagicales bacterium]
MKVLVTGASGVVGGATVRALIDGGHTVSTLQRGPLPESLLARGVTGHVGSITDASAVENAVAGVDAVVHAAARVEVIGPWSEFESINVRGTQSVFSAAQRAGAARFVYVSSPSVAHAGSALVGATATPADPEHARSHYARSKAQAEQWVLAQRSGKMSAVAIRPHLVWGPGDTQLTARIVQRARAGRLVIIGSGAALIDTTYVDNAGSAIAAAVNRCSDEQVQGRAFIVSNGEPRTVAEMVTRIAHAAGAAGPRRSVPYPVARAGAHVVVAAWERTRRSGEPPITPFVAEQLATAHWFDLTPTYAALQWTPAVSIDEGFERLARWYGGFGVNL